LLWIVWNCVLELDINFTTNIMNIFVDILSPHCLYEGSLFYSMFVSLLEL
jgi:hypothetical protein